MTRRGRRSDPAAPGSEAEEAAGSGSGPLGAVLAGGRSSRFGAPKALAELGGRTLVERAVDAVTAAGLDPVVVVREGSPVPDRLVARLVRDPPGPAHPLRAIATALGEAGAAVVLACDLPFVPPPLLAWLGGLSDPVAVVEIGGRLQPLLGRYDAGVAADLAAAADRDEAAGEAILRLGARRVGEADLRRFGDPARIAFNVNRPEDLAQAERLLATHTGLCRCRY
jgi:molybdopterin-guanine dinucleotide biosynthesis protein A